MSTPMGNQDDEVIFRKSKSENNHVDIIFSVRDSYWLLSTIVITKTIFLEEEYVFIEINLSDERLHNYLIDKYESIINSAKECMIIELCHESGYKSSITKLSIQKLSPNSIHLLGKLKDPYNCFSTYHIQSNDPFLERFLQI